MRNGKWEDYELNFIKENYKTMTNKKIAEKLDRTKTAVDLKINRLGLIKSKYIYNHDFFQDINSEEKAYWLGFIYADGCVSINSKGNNSGEIAIKLFKGDAKHLKKFNKSINGNVEVAYSTRVCSFNNKPQEACIIRLYSIKMANDLIKHGAVQNKTFIIQFTNIDDELICHFIRGYFDGDGCICVNNKDRKDLQINFCTASEMFVNQLREVLYKFGIKSYITDEKDRSTFRLYIKGLRNCDNMWNFMFKNATVYLDRKFKKKELLYKEYNIAQRLLL